MPASISVTACGTTVRLNPPAVAAMQAADPSPAIVDHAPAAAVSETSVPVSMLAPLSPLDLDASPNGATRPLPSDYATGFKPVSWAALMYEPDDAAIPRPRPDEGSTSATSRIPSMPKDTLASQLRSAASHVSDQTNHRLDFTHGQVIINISDTVFYRMEENEIVCRWTF